MTSIMAVFALRACATTMDGSDGYVSDDHVLRLEGLSGND
jgi:hypothetical protein